MAASNEMVLMESAVDQAGCELGLVEPPQEATSTTAVSSGGLDFTKLAGHLSLGINGPTPDLRASVQLWR